MTPRGDSPQACARGPLLAGCTSATQPSPPTNEPTASEVPAGPVFNQTRHIVLEDPISDGYETVTAVAHVCPADDPDCPDGEEPIIVLASYRFAPSRIYTHHPEMTLVPPDECLREDSRCRLTLAHCEYPDFDSQMAHRHCVPQPVNEVPIATAEECLDQVTDFSHHVRFDCLTDQPRQGTGESS